MPNSLNGLINEIALLDEKIKAYDKSYYVDARPTISDQEYDALLVRLRGLVDSLTDKSVISTVLDKPGSDLTGYLKEVSHIRPMLSIRTEVDITEAPIEEFDKRCSKYLNDNYVQYIAEPKYDGIALSLRYDSFGALQAAVTRGNGLAGEDITASARHIKGIEEIIDVHLGIDEIRGEIMLAKKYFDKANEIRLVDSDTPFVNCRNAAAGIVRRKDPKVDLLKLMVFVPYSAFGTNLPDTQAKTLDALNKLLKTHEYLEDHIAYTVTDAKGLYQAYKDLQEKRPLLEYDIDGIVYKVNDLSAHDKLGVSGREPRWCIAHKFSAEVAFTKLLDIELQVGPSGRITPVAKLDPIFVGGTTISSVTLSNFFQVRQKGVRVGDMVTVRRAGDVIPEITGVDPTYIRRGYQPNTRAPKVCPCCGSATVRRKEEVNYYCPNSYGCSAQFTGTIERMASRKVLDIQAMGTVMSDILYKSGRLANPLEIFDLTKEDLRDMGVGPLTAAKVSSEIQKVKANEMPFSKFLLMLGIHGIGERASEKIATQVKDIFELIDRLDDLYSIKGLTVAHIRDIKEFFSRQDIPDSAADTTIPMTEVVKALYAKLNVTPLVRQTMGPLSGLTIVLTGSADNISRDDLKDKIKTAGGNVASSVSKSTSLVVFGQGAGSKLKDAQKHNVPMITYQDFLDKYPELV